LSLTETAALHNRILQKLVQATPGLTGDTRRTLVAGLVEQSDLDELDVLELPTYELLSQMDIFYPISPESYGSDFPFTRYFVQPSPARFFKFTDWITQDDAEDYSYVILLYDRQFGVHDGGIFFNLLDSVAIWHYFPKALPPLSSWKPLHKILTYCEHMWDIGK
jgi:hypothetical protein